MGKCTLDIGAVVNRRFIESDESIWYKVPFLFVSNVGVRIFTCFLDIMMVCVTGGCVALQYQMFRFFLML